MTRIGYLGIDVAQQVGSVMRKTRDVVRKTGDVLKAFALTILIGPSRQLSKHEQTGLEPDDVGLASATILRRSFFG